MFADKFITDSIPPVRPSDSLETVLAWMAEFKVTHLPVVSDQRLLGIVSEQELLETTGGNNQTVSELSLERGEKSYVYEDSHIYDVMKLMLGERMDIAPVVSSRDNHYLGLITRDGLLAAASNMLNVEEPGGVIVLEVPQNSYSLSEIGRIAESSEAKILSLAVEIAPNPIKLNITIKCNLRDMSSLIASFERFEYTISHVIFDSDQLEDYRERYENLIRYLNL